MIKLDATTKSLEVVLAGAITTNQLPITAMYSDYADAAGTLTLGESDGATNSTTAVTAVAAPASGVVRTVDFLTIYNKDTVDATVTVRLNNNGTIREEFKQTLTAGQCLQYTRNGGWQGPGPFAVSATSLPLPSNAAQETGGNLATIAALDFATQTTLALIKAKTDNLDVALSTRTKPADTQAVSAASLPLPTGASTEATTLLELAQLAGIKSNTATIADTMRVEDGASADGDLGIGVLAIRKATPANLSGTDGDYEFLQMAAGRLWVDSSGVTLTVASHAVTNAGTFAVQATQAGTWTVTGAGGTFPVTDSGGSLTVDAPVGTPVFVRLSDGSAAIATLPVSLASVPSHAVTNAGTFAVQESGTQIQVDDAAFTPATSKILMAGAEFDDSSPDSVDEGDGGALRMSANRNLYIRIRDNAGNERGLNIDANGALAATVTNAGTFAVQATIAAGATAIAKAEDVASVDADVGVPAMAVRKATPANTSGTDGDYEFLQMSAGRLWTSTVIDTALPAGSNAIGTVDTELPAAAALSDTIANPTAPMVGAAGMCWDETQWVRKTGNLGRTLLASAARVASTASALQANKNCKGIRLWIRVTANSGAISLTPVLWGRMPVSGGADLGFWQAAANLTALATYCYELYPGAATAAPGGGFAERVQAILPYSWYLNMVHNNANSVTYTVECELIL